VRQLKRPVPFAWPGSSPARSGLRWLLNILSFAWLFVNPTFLIFEVESPFLVLVIFWTTTLGGMLFFWWLADRFRPIESESLAR
jgi:hypothetical protein